MEEINQLIDSALSKEEQFAIWGIEYYRSEKKISGRKMAENVKKYNLLELFKENYFLWHIESPENFIIEIDTLFGS